MRRRVVLLAPLSLLIARAACAHSFRLGSIEIGHPWAKPSATDAAAMFLALSNTGSKADRLLGGETPAAAEVLLRDRGGAPMEYLDLLPRRPVALRPGGRYIALRGLKAPLAIDDNFPMILRFAEAGSITVTVTVEDAPEE
jgi:periplasmic copper chaperone A